MYRTLTKIRGYLDQLEPPWQIEVIEENEPATQLGESVIHATRNVVPRRAILNTPDEKKYISLNTPQIFTEELSKGAELTREIKSTLNKHGFLTPKESWRSD
jgi:hypothetical protein